MYNTLYLWKLIALKFDPSFLYETEKARQLTGRHGFPQYRL